MTFFRPLRDWRVLFSIVALGISVLLSACGHSSRTTDRSDDDTSAEALTPNEILVSGQKQYHLRGCIKCHGRIGEGDGYRTQGLPPEKSPRNFRVLTAYKQGSDLRSIAFTIKNGITNQPPVGRRGLLGWLGLGSTNIISSTGMPAYPHLTDEEISHIAHYVLYLQTNHNQPKN